MGDHYAAGSTGRRCNPTVIFDGQFRDSVTGLHIGLHLHLHLKLHARNMKEFNYAQRLEIFIFINAL